MKNLVVEMSFNLIGRKLRKKINPNKMCSECFNEYKWQTKNGKLLCERCYSIYLKKISKG